MRRYRWMRVDLYIYSICYIMFLCYTLLGSSYYVHVYIYILVVVDYDRVGSSVQFNSIQFSSNVLLHLIYLFILLLGSILHLSHRSHFPLSLFLSFFLLRGNLPSPIYRLLRMRACVRACLPSGPIAIAIAIAHWHRFPPAQGRVTSPSVCMYETA